jgi:hypothetical protein
MTFPVKTTLGETKAAEHMALEAAFVVAATVVAAEAVVVAEAVTFPEISFR